MRTSAKSVGRSMMMLTTRMPGLGVTTMNVGDGSNTGVLGLTGSHMHVKDSFVVTVEA